MPKDGRSPGNSESREPRLASWGGNYGLAWRVKLLRNKAFFSRYIIANVNHAYWHLFGYNPKLSRNILAFAWREARLP